MMNFSPLLEEGGVFYRGFGRTKGVGDPIKVTGSACSDQKIGQFIHIERGVA
jgi:hypothetical protein